jgi:asparaginyl-tRNA synthetase
MVEPEVAYAELDDIMNLAEEFITFIVQRVLENRRKELTSSNATFQSWRTLRRRFRGFLMTMRVKMLQEAHAKGELQERFEWGGDFGAPMRLIYRTSLIAR